MPSLPCRLAKDLLRAASASYDVFQLSALKSSKPQDYYSVSMHLACWRLFLPAGSNHVVSKSRALYPFCMRMERMVRASTHAGYRKFPYQYGMLVKSLPSSGPDAMATHSRSTARRPVLRLESVLQCTNSAALCESLCLALA